MVKRSGHAEAFSGRPLLEGGVQRAGPGSRGEPRLRSSRLRSSRLPRRGRSRFVRCLPWSLAEEPLHRQRSASRRPASRRDARPGGVKRTSMTSNRQSRRAVLMRGIWARCGRWSASHGGLPRPPLAARILLSYSARRSAWAFFAASSAFSAAFSAASAACSPACCASCSACSRSAASARSGVAPMPVTMPTALPPPLLVVRILVTLAVQYAMGGTYPARMAMTTKQPDLRLAQSAAPAARRSPPSRTLVTALARASRRSSRAGQPNAAQRAQ
jgi:hypothetical protein